MIKIMIEIIIIITIMIKMIIKILKVTINIMIVTIKIMITIIIYVRYVSKGFSQTEVFPNGNFPTMSSASSQVWTSPSAQSPIKACGASKGLT